MLKGNYIMNRNAKAFIDAATEKFGTEATINRDQIQKLVEEKNLQYPHWFVSRKEYRAARGLYKLPTFGAEPVKTPSIESVELVATVHQLRQPKMVDDSMPSVPALFPDYVPFGFYRDLKKIITTKDFYPVFITGHSGNGKTLMVEQICAELKRECIRVNISIETDENDLLGGPTLIDGNVVQRDGPVLIAMKRGALLLIDEVDRGSNKLMCLQGIMEGKPYYNKKNGEVVYPAPGFNIIATANTKGRGSDEGKYLSQILDDAFLERFVIAVEQEYPNAKTEKKILSALIKDEEFVDNLVKWAEVIRKSFEEGATDEIISTRRLVHIAKTFNIFNNRMRAIELCVSRFDTDTKNSFIDLYTKVDAKVETDPASPVPEEDIPDDIPF
jgi:MoxR-like ATPase